MFSVVTFFKERLNERSTYMFIISSLATIDALHQPWNYVGGTLLFLAALVPDNPKL